MSQALKLGTISQNEVFNLLKLLIELGGYYKLDNNKYIIRVDGETPVQTTHNGKKLPIMVFHEDMSVGEHTILNPFSGAFGDSPEQDWLFKFISILPGMLAWQLIKTGMVQVMSEQEGKDSKTTAGMKAAALMAKVHDQIDAKMLVEMDSLQESNFGRIHYAKNTKTATLRLAVLSDDISEEYSAIRKKTWKVLRALLEDIYPEAYSVQSASLACPKLEATLLVLNAALDAAKDKIEDILEQPVAAGALRLHLGRLGDYAKYCAYCTSLVAEKPGDDEKKPWETDPHKAPVLAPIGTITAVTAGVCGASALPLGLTPMGVVSATPNPGVITGGLTPVMAPPVIPTGLMPVGMVQAIPTCSFAPPMATLPFLRPIC